MLPYNYKGMLKIVNEYIEEGNIKTVNLLECASKVYDTIELLNLLGLKDTSITLYSNKNYLIYYV